MKSIDYTSLLAGVLESNYEATLAAFTQAIINAWLDEYDALTKNENDIVKFTADGFSFLNDLNESDYATEFIPGVSRETRIVAAYGITQNKEIKRNASRQQAYIGGFKSMPRYIGFDKGHFIAHSIGGMLEQNLFPQRSDVNRGISDEGKKWIEVEKFCARNSEIFMFSRPLYKDPSWIPSEVEIGYLTKDFKVVSVIVSN